MLVARREERNLQQMDDCGALFLQILLEIVKTKKSVGVCNFWYP